MPAFSYRLLILLIFFIHNLEQKILANPTSLSDLELSKTVDTPYNTYHLTGKNRVDIELNITVFNDFKTFKTKIKKVKSLKSLIYFL